MNRSTDEHLMKEWQESVLEREREKIKNELFSRWFKFCFDEFGRHE